MREEGTRGECAKVGQLPGAADLEIVPTTMRVVLEAHWSPGGPGWRPWMEALEPWLDQVREPPGDRRQGPQGTYPV